jgi:hypothetical protein
MRLCENIKNLYVISINGIIYGDNVYDIKTAKAVLELINKNNNEHGKVVTLSYAIKNKLYWN